MKPPIRVGIVDDHLGMRIEIRKLLANTTDIIIVGEGVNGLEAIQLADQEKPDVLLLDVEMPVLRGDEVVQRIQKNRPEVKVLALSSYDDPVYIRGMLENGAAGYITKDEAPNILLGAIRSVILDKVKWISPSVANRVSYITLDNKTFTGRELEILRFVAMRKSDKEICRLLSMDIQLLARYIETLIKKFHVSSREDLRDAAQRVISTTNS